MERRIWTLLLAAALVLSLLAGCGQKVPVRDTAAETEPAYTEPAPTEPEQTKAPTLPPPEANPYSPEDFVYEGNFLTCTAAPTSVGIDVSIHQGIIDWQQVADAGVEFAMIRAGYRGYKYGQVKMDDNALINIDGAKSAGIRVGVYFFSQAVNAAEAREEAQFLLSVLEGIELDLPVVYDWEYISEEARTAEVDGQTLMECTVAFCQEIAAAGRQPMVYFNSNQAHNLLRLEMLTDYPFWLAQYDVTAAFPYRVYMWQYTNRGSVPGIAGNVDLNIGFFTLDAV